MSTRTVSWGDALAVEMFKTPGGLRHVVDAINEVMGPHYGTRNTFGKLLRATGPDELSPRDEWRAWLLLTALGQDPMEWGLPENLAPKYMNVDQLRWDLIEAVRTLPRVDSNHQPAVFATTADVIDLAAWRAA